MLAGVLLSPTLPPRPQSAWRACVVQGSATAANPGTAGPWGSLPLPCSVHHSPNMCAGGYPELRTLLCIGGVDMKTQTDAVRGSGVHMVVATPGRLKDMLAKRRMNLDICRWGGCGRGPTWAVGTGSALGTRWRSFRDLSYEHYHCPLHPGFLSSCCAPPSTAQTC